MLHDRRGNDIGPNGKGTSRVIVAEKLDAQTDASRGPQRGRFAVTSPRARVAGPLARRRSSAYRKHTIQHVTSDEGLGGTSIEERHATVRRHGVTSAMYCNFGSKRNVVERHSTPDKAGAVFWQRKARADAGSYLQNFLALVGRRVRENVRKRHKRTLASAGRAKRARLRPGRNFVDSSIPRGSTEPTSGGRVCQPGLSVANCFANRRKRLTEQIFSHPLAWVFGSGIVRPKTNAPHCVERAGFG